MDRDGVTPADPHAELIVPLCHYARHVQDLACQLRGLMLKGCDSWAGFEIRYRARIANGYRRKLLIEMRNLDQAMTNWLKALSEEKDEYGPLS